MDSTEFDTVPFDALKNVVEMDSPEFNTVPFDAFRNSDPWHWISSRLVSDDNLIQLAIYMPW